MGKSEQKDRSEVLDTISELLSGGLEKLRDLRARWHEYEPDESLNIPGEEAAIVIERLVERLKENYPFWHPSYAGQMLKPPHYIASVAYFLAQQINPNNHALDGGIATSKMEIESVEQLARMFGYETFLGHLTSSGTIANLEALWVARSLHPQKKIAFSTEAHYTHKRMCDVVGAGIEEIAVDGAGRMDIGHLCEKLKEGQVGTVVMTAGTTGLGAIDPINLAVEIKREFDFRIHVDAAYGGFFRLLAEDTGLLSREAADSFGAIAHADSVVIDPHKHGLQPYGCGCVIFRDPAVGRIYKHDSPYTYFVSGDLHLGEISLECSRAGAAAAALWATLQCFPLEANKGLGSVLQKTRKAALDWAELIESSDELRLVTWPELDIINYYAVTDGYEISRINRLTNRVFEDLMNDTEDPLYLAKINLRQELVRGHGELIWDVDRLTAFRSVLMKPEQVDYVPRLHDRVLKALKQ